jgi:hypothetical protein
MCFTLCSIVLCNCVVFVCLCIHVFFVVLYLDRAVLSLPVKTRNFIALNYGWFLMFIGPCIIVIVEE